MKKFFAFSFLFTVVCFVASYFVATTAGYKGGEDLGTFLAESYIGSKDFSTSVAQEVKIPKEQITSVVVAVNSQDVKVQSSDRDQIVIKLNGKLINAQKDRAIPEIIKTEISQNALKISVDEDAFRHAIDAKSDRGMWNFQINGNSFGSSVDLEVLLPIEIKELEMRASSGDLQLLSGRYDSVYIKANSGDIKVENSDIDELQFDLTSGDVKADLEARNIKGRVTSGDIKLKLATLDPNIDLSLSSGDAEVKFKGPPDLKMSLNTSSGEIEAFEKETDNDSQPNYFEATYGTGKGNLRINTSSGDIEVEQE